MCLRSAIEVTGMMVLYKYGLYYTYLFQTQKHKGGYEPVAQFDDNTTAPVGTIQV